MNKIQLKFMLKLTKTTNFMWQRLPHNKRHAPHSSGIDSPVSTTAPKPPYIPNVVKIKQRKEHTSHVTKFLPRKVGTYNLINPQIPMYTKMIDALWKQNWFYGITNKIKKLRKNDTSWKLITDSTGHTVLNDQTTSVSASMQVVRQHTKATSWTSDWRSTPLNHAVND